MNKTAPRFFKIEFILDPLDFSDSFELETAARAALLDAETTILSCLPSSIVIFSSEF